MSTDKIVKRVTLTDEEFELKCSGSVSIIRNKLQIIRKYENELLCAENKELRDALRVLSFQYSPLSKYNVTLSQKQTLRFANMEILIEDNNLNTLVNVLENLVQSEIYSRQNFTTFVDKVDEYKIISIQKLLDIFLNYSDLSEKFGECLCGNEKYLGISRRILDKLVDKFLNDQLNGEILRILRYSISILYNMLLHQNADNLMVVRQWKFFEQISPLLNCSNERLKISVLLFTVYVADEKDSTLFRTDNRSIVYLLSLLDKAMKTKFQRYSGLSVLEISKGLERLSKNDENKQMLVDLGILERLKKLTMSSHIKYKEVALSIMWSLAFDERNRQLIAEVMMQDLTQLDQAMMNQYSSPSCNTGPPPPPPPPPLSKSIDSTVKETSTDPAFPTENESEKIATEKEDADFEEAADDSDEPLMNSTELAKEKIECQKKLHGLLWTLRGSCNSKESQRESAELASDEIQAAGLFIAKKSKKKTKGSIGPTEQHIMISYCWANSDIVVAIYKQLINHQYKIWIDKYNMAETENIMESMAYAVENSKAVIICISSSYKDSQNCRSEAQYAISKKKSIIPVMVQRKYRPDGWLGFCVAGLQYCDFQGRYTFSEAFDLLLKQLHRLFQPDTDNSIDKEDKIEPTTDEHQSKLPVVDSNQSNFSKWTNQEVRNWLDQLGIKKINWDPSWSGAELQFLSVIGKTAPGQFVEVCHRYLAVDDLKDLRLLFDGTQITDS